VFADPNSNTSEFWLDFDSSRRPESVDLCFDKGELFPRWRSEWPSG